MQPTRISGADPRPLGAPQDWNEADHGHCGGLFVRRENVEGLAFMRSAWEVTPVEAGLLLAGARLTLGVSGNCHPVVQLGVAEIPPDFEPVVYARRQTSVTGEAQVRVEMAFPPDGRRGYSTVPVLGRLCDAVAAGVEHIELMARKEGWID